MLVFYRPKSLMPVQFKSSSARFRSHNPLPPPPHAAHIKPFAFELDLLHRLRAVRAFLFKHARDLHPAHIGELLLLPPCGAPVFLGEGADQSVLIPASVCSSSICRAFDNADENKPVGMATIPRPINNTKKVKMRPPRVTGYTSP